jgi:hypothetical protein
MNDEDRIIDVLEEQIGFEWAAATSVSAGYALGSAALAVLQRLGPGEYDTAMVIKGVFEAAKHNKPHGRNAFLEVVDTGILFRKSVADIDAAWDAAVLAAGDGFDVAQGNAGAEASDSAALFLVTYKRVVRGIIGGMLCPKKSGKLPEASPLCLDVAIFAAETLNGTNAACAFARELSEIRAAFRGAVPAKNELRAAALASLAGINDGKIHEGGDSYHFPGNKVESARESARSAICEVVRTGFSTTSLPAAGGNVHIWRAAILPDLERRAVALVDLESLVPKPTMPTAHDASVYEVQPDASMFASQSKPLARPATVLQANMSKADEVLSDMLPRLLRDVAEPMFRRGYMKLVEGWDWNAWPCDCPDPEIVLKNDEKKPKEELKNDGKKPEGEPKKDKEKIVHMYYQAGRCQRCDALFPRIVEMHSKFVPARADESRGVARSAIDTTGLASSASRLWGDPVRGPFEVAKLFMGKLGATGLAKQSFEECDLAGLINLMTWCRVFAAARINTKEVQENRNTLIGHKAAQELATPQLIKVLNEAAYLVHGVVFDKVECTLKVFFFSIFV